MLIGVWPLATVVAEDSTGMKSPFLLSSVKKSIPGWMSSKEPPFARADAWTPAKTEPDVVGSPLSATWPLYSGLRRSARVEGQVLTRLASQPSLTVWRRP